MKTRIVCNIDVVASVLVLLCIGAIPADANIIAVTNTNDSGSGSLRQALADANDGDTIDATGISGAVTLTSGVLLVDKSVTINGAGADMLAVDGNALSRVFQIAAGTTVTISDFTIRNGHAGTTGAGVDNESNATVTIINCVLSGNAAGLGSGVFNGGMLTIANSTVSGNTSSSGAGVYNDGSGTLMVTNSTVSGNTATLAGGGIFNIGTVAITNSTFSDNAADLGAIHNEDTLDVGNTILNTGAAGGKIFDNSGSIISHGYNLCSDDGDGFLTGPGDQVNTDPVLGPLQDNGGPTFTHELLPGSPAINAGEPNFTPPPFFDQRGPGFNRVVTGRLDIGSFEVQSGATPTPTSTATPTPTPTPTPAATPSPTATPTPTATPKHTPTPTVTPIPTSTPTASPTPTATSRVTPRPRPTPHSRPTPP